MNDSKIREGKPFCNISFLSFSNVTGSIVCEASLRNNMSENILRQVVVGMEETFMTGVEESNQQQPELAIVGSSCLFCIVWRGTLYIANVGDSRAVLSYSLTKSPI
jgi:pyruvate dehydrogenase phosphatase